MPAKTYFIASKQRQGESDKVFVSYSWICRQNHNNKII